MGSFSQTFEQPVAYSQSKISNGNFLLRGLEKELGDKELQLELKEKNSRLLLLQLAEKSGNAKGNTFSWVVRVLAALGTGFILGNLAR